jgi:hypothetical protein
VTSKKTSRAGQGRKDDGAERGHNRGGRKGKTCTIPGLLCPYRAQILPAH